MLRKARIPTAFLTAPALAIATLASSASAEEFSWQLSGGYGETEIDLFADAERTTLDATYYLDPVDDSRGPYALAPFLNRSGRVTVGVTNDKTMITSLATSYSPLPPGSPTTVDTIEDTTGYFISGRYVWSASGWYVGAAYRDTDTDLEPSSPASHQDTTTDGYQLFGGRYFGESTSLDLGAGATRQTTDLTVSCVTLLCLSGGTTTQIDTDDWSIGALHVRQGARLTYSITGRVSRAEVTPSFDPLVLTLPSGAPPSAAAPMFPGAAFGVSSASPFTLISPRFTGLTGQIPITDERETYSIGGELFPTERLSFRIGVARTDGNYAEDESYDVASTWFFTRAAAVQFVLTRTEHEIGPSFSRDIDSAEIRFFGRL